MSSTTQKLFAIAPAWANERDLLEPQNSFAEWREGSIGRLQVDGIFTKALCQQIRDAVVGAVGDPNINELLIEVDSPGGSVAGTPDLAETIRQARDQKPITVVVDNLAASAGCWFASSASRVVMSPAAMTGSIGVVSILVDSSELMERIGLKVITIATGKHKGAGAWGTKLSGEQIDQFQHLVDQIGRQFIAAVARGRGLAAGRVSEVADGRVLMAREALAAGLVDEVRTAADYIEERLAAWRLPSIADYIAMVKSEAGCRPEDLTPNVRRSLLAAHPQLESAAAEFDRQSKRFYKPGAYSVPWNQPH